MTIAADQQSTPRIRTVSIGPSRACPSVDPIPAEGFSHGGRHFTAAELAVVGAAIDAGIFYTDDLKDFCRSEWEALHPATDRCLTATGDLPYQLLNDHEYAGRREAARALEASVAAAARGTWGLLRHDWADGDHQGVTYTMFIAVGSGSAYGVQTGAIHHAGRVPGYEDAIQQMVGYEIYLADIAEKRRREEARSRAVIQAAGLVPGKALRNIQLGSKTYSSGTVEEVVGAGYVKLLLVKRGSRTRWNWTGLAQSIKADGISDTLPAYGALTVTEH